MKYSSMVLNASMVVGAVAAPAAQAQSYITLYGVMDVGIEGLNNAPKADGSSAAIVRQTSGSLSGSRWGLRGAEKLRDGLSVVFVLENGFNVNNGMLGQNGRVFGRQAYVGLRTPAGTVTVGRHQNLLFDVMIGYDPMQYASYSAAGHDEELVGRADNSIKYTGKFGGLTLAAMYSANVDATIGDAAPTPGISRPGNQTGSNTGRLYSGAVDYANGPFDIGAVYDQRQRGSSAGTDIGARRMYVGARCKLATTDLYAAYGLLQRSVGPTQTTASLYWLGAAQHFTAAVQMAVGAYHTDVRGSDQDPTSYVMSLNYLLSKRTDLYLIASYATNNDGSNLGINGFGVNIVPGDNQVGAMVGFRHAF